MLYLVDAQVFTHFGINKCNYKYNLSLKDATQIFRLFRLYVRSDVSQNYILFDLVPFQDTWLTRAHFSP